MLVIVILTLIILGGIALVVWGDFGGYDGKENAKFTGCAVIFIFGLILTILLAAEMPWKRDIQYDIAKYEELKAELVQTSDRPVVQKELVDKVYEMNIYIDKNRIKSTSLWVGWFYSKEIGELSKLEIK